LPASEWNFSSSLVHSSGNRRGPFLFRTIARELATEKLGLLNDRELEQQRQQREQHKDRNREWKRMEREGASMARKRAFAKEGRERQREPERGREYTKA
jgi:hypothetical protein